MATISLKLNVSGPGCRHIHILNDKGKLLDVTHEDDLVQPITKEDSDLIIQIKDAVAKSAEKIDWSVIKSIVEARDYILDTTDVIAVPTSAVDPLTP